MQGLRPVGLGVGRSALAVAAAGVAPAGMLVALAGPVDGAHASSPALTVIAEASCAASGPYLAPGPDSVGVPVGLRLCPSGPITVTTAGAVLDGLDVTGGIVVDAPGVVVRRSRITGDGRSAYGVTTTGAGSVRIEDTTVTGTFTEAGIGDDDWTAERVEIARVTGDGARLGSRATLRNSWLHDFTPGRRERGAAASDGIAVIRGNLLGGGEYTLRQLAGARGSAREVRISGNRFRRDATAGPVQVPATSLLVDNIFVDGGAVTRRG